MKASINSFHSLLERPDLSIEIFCLLINFSKIVSSLKKENFKSRITDELSKYKNLNHRIDEICSLNGINFVNDSKATNPAAANFAINQFNDIYWILGGLSKDNDLNKLDLSNQNIKKIFLIGSSSKQISKIIPKNINFEVSYNLENATISAYEEALKDQKGCVLLSPGCSSQDEFNDYQDRGNMFTKIVNNLEVKC